jgi:hypothetical protein
LVLFDRDLVGTAMVFPAGWFWIVCVGTAIITVLCIELMWRIMP